MIVENACLILQILQIDEREKEVKRFLWIG
jgi:hypothetical protein